jgi:hypothetical protein
VNFGLPEAFAYADQIWMGGMFMVAFMGGWIVGGICQR